MVLLVQRAHEAIEDVLAGPSAQAPNQIINDAGRWLTTSHKWKYLEGQLRTLDFVKNQPYVELPDDFRSLQAINRPSGFTSSFELVSFAYMMDLRTVTPTVGTFRFWGHIVHRQKGSTTTLTHDTSIPANTETITVNGTVYTFQTTLTNTANNVLARTSGLLSFDNLVSAINLTGTSGTDYAAATVKHTTVSAKRTSTTVITFEALEGGEAGDAFTLTETLGDTGSVAVSPFSGGGGAPTVRLDIYPTPTSDESGALNMFYHRGWPTVTTDTTALSVPVELEAAMLETVRAFARGYADNLENPNMLSVYLESVVQGRPYQDAIDWDYTVQPHVGTLKQGIGQPRVSSRHLDTQSLSAPS